MSEFEDYIDPGAGEKPAIEMGFSSHRFIFTGETRMTEPENFYPDYRSEICDYIDKVVPPWVELQFRYSYVTSGSISQLRELTNDVLSRAAQRKQEDNVLKVQIVWHNAVDNEHMRKNRTAFEGIVTSIIDKYEVKDSVTLMIS